MHAYTSEEIHQCFSASEDFNEIFDVFEWCILQQIKDMEVYRLLFWNQSLSPDEIRLFGEKLAAQFPDLGYDIFNWLATIFEATVSSNDNHELALQYYRRAAKVKPAALEPYLAVCDCYEPDLNIPPIHTLIEFVKEGTVRVIQPQQLYFRLARLYELAGDAAQAELYRVKADESNASSEENPTA